MISFMVIFSTIIGFMALYAWWRCLRQMVLPKRVRHLFTAVLALLALASVSYLPLRRLGVVDDAVLELFAAAVGAVFLFFALAVIYDLMLLLGRWWLKRPQRSDRWRLGFDLAVVLTVAIALIAALAGAAKAPQITAHTVAIEGIEKPLRIAHLTDLHLGNSPRLGARFARSVVEQVNALGPDLVVITGDLVDRPADEVSALTQPLANLQSRYGTFFVAGNHEYIHGLEAISDQLRDRNMTVLENESHTLQTDAGAITLVGILDPMGQRLGFSPPDAQAAFRGVGRDEVVVVLAHQPIVIHDLAPESFDLFLAGHTHGGQIFPFGLLVRTEQPYLRGLYRHDARGFIFVSSGTGYWGPPMRLFAPAEIGLITLEPR